MKQRLTREKEARGGGGTFAGWAAVDAVRMDGVRLGRVAPMFDDGCPYRSGRAVQHVLRGTGVSGGGRERERRRATPIARAHGSDRKASSAVGPMPQPPCGT